MGEHRTSMEVGFIGLGKMGAAMAANLLKCGHRVTVFNRTSSKAQQLVDNGARLASCVKDACQSDIVITMLSDDYAIEEIVFSQGGMLQSMRERGIHISMSTISVALSEKLAASHTQAGQHFIAAPVFGRPDAAAAGKLYIIAAGKADIVDICMPLFESIGQKTSYISDSPQAAILVKLSGNFLIASLIEALSEAMALVEKSGIERRKYFELLNSTLFTVPLFTNYGGLIAEKKFKPAGFAAPLGKKDIRLALNAADKLNVPMPLASLLHDRFVTLIARGGEDLDWSALGQLAANDAGL
jgi:3-hydroxyisobutyrate dehydrogenase-like beta-hydroxyacid dehydrogenase